MPICFVFIFCKKVLQKANWYECRYTNPLCEKLNSKISNFIVCITPKSIF